MTDFDKWLKTDIAVAKKTDIEKEEKFRKEIMDLAKRYGWELESTPDLFELNPILVKMTNWPAGHNRPLDEIKEFKKELVCILQDYGLAIVPEDSYDNDISNDSRSRRIVIRLKRKD